MGRGQGTTRRREGAGGAWRAGNSGRVFGQALQRFLYQPDTFALLPGYGWLDGGCWTLASAVRRWLGEDTTALYGIANDDGRVQHVVVRVGDWYLDGDGAARSAALLRRWREVERIAGAHLVPIDDDAVRRAEIPLVPEISELLAVRLAAHFDRAAVLETLTDGACPP